MDCHVCRDRGNWHGDVAIKMLNMETNLDHQAQLQAFKLEVAMLRKTRHENLVLFMGACMKQPHLAVITRYVDMQRPFLENLEFYWTYLIQGLEMVKFYKEVLNSFECCCGQL